MNGSSFAQRVAHASAATGLSAAQLGVARVYERPHVFSPTPPGGPRPLEGVEVLIKDLQQVEGEVASFGSVAQEFTAARHDTAAQRLLEQGAVLVGASSTAEFGVAAYTEPVGQDEPVNPLGAQWLCGGSSGGAAVAVARGLVDVAHATDGGGSIRIPAACCGLPGLKPRHEHTRGGFTPTAHGFLARDLGSTARAYGLEIPDLEAAVRSGARAPLRLGYTNQPFHSEGTALEPDIAAATGAAAMLLTSTEVASGISQPPAPYSSGEKTFALFAELLAARCADLPGELSPITRWLKDTGRGVGRGAGRERLEHLDHLQTQLRGIAEQVERTWDDYDVILTPTLACAPPPPGTFSAMEPEKNFRAQTAWTPWGTLWNMTGWAALSVPLVSPERLKAYTAEHAAASRWPISLMIGAVSDRVSEAELLALGKMVQRLTDQFGVEQLTIAAPGSMAALNFPPPPRGHSHAGHAHEH